MLELAAPADPVACRKFDFCLDLLLGVRHEGPEVASTDVGGDDDASFALLPADLVGARGEIDLREFGKRHVANLG